MRTTFSFFEFFPHSTKRWVAGAVLASTKKLAAELTRLKRFKGLSDDERIPFARSFAMSPDERWRTHEGFLRSHGLFMHSARKAFGFK